MAENIVETNLSLLEHETLQVLVRDLMNQIKVHEANQIRDASLDLVSQQSEALKRLRDSNFDCEVANEALRKQVEILQAEVGRRDQRISQIMAEKTMIEVKISSLEKLQVEVIADGAKVKARVKDLEEENATLTNQLALLRS